MARSIYSLCVCVLLFSAFACSTRVAPRVVPVKKLAPFGEGRIYLEASRDYERIAESFRNMGIPVSNAPHGTDLTVKARLGRSRGSGECGASHNMQWLVYQGTYLVAKMVGRGPIGHCSDNIVDAMTAELKWFLESNKSDNAIPAPAPVPAPPPEPEPAEDDPWADS